MNMNILFNLIKPSSSSKYKLITIPTPRSNLFNKFYSNIQNPHEKTYIKKEQTLLSIIKKSCRTKKHIEQLHAHLVQTGFFQNLYLVGKIIVFCATSNECCMDYSVSVFDKINNPDGFLWNTMIRGFGNVNKVDEVFFYYKKMVEYGEVVDNFTLCFLLKASGSILLGKQVHCSVVKHGFESHVFVRNTLIHMYGNLKDFVYARQVFDEMPQRPGLVGWNTMIDCYVCCGKFKEALELFYRMLHDDDDGVTPDNATLTVVLSACAALGELELGKWIHSVVIDRSLLTRDLSLANSLIHMYTRCGEMEDARRVFSTMSDKNVVTWNTMILGLATHGHVQEALSMFSLMMNKNAVPPDDVTFLGVLTACSHGGMVEKGKEYFQKITDEYQMNPSIKHYGCMVDMLSRAGLVTEAYNLVQNMPMKCNAIIWRTLLAGCNTHGNIKLAEKVRGHLLEVEPDHSSDYVLLANTYASLEDWNQVSEVRRSMVVDGVQKPSPGNSFIGVPSGF